MIENKRGQVTLFIIIAVVIVAIIVLIIFLQRSSLGPELPETEAIKVKSYIDDCLELKIKQGILALGKQGGYYNLDNVESITFLDEQTAYYWKNEANLVPSLDVIEQELNFWLNDNIDNCFSFEDYDITTESCSINSEITETVSVDFDCSITVKKNNAVSKLNEFTIQFDAPVAKLLNVSGQIITEYSTKPGYVCVTCFDGIALTNNVTITAVPVTSETFEPEHIWFLITDKNIKFEEQNITWRFVTDL